MDSLIVIKQDWQYSQIVGLGYQHKKLIRDKNHFYLNFAHNCGTNYFAINLMDVKNIYLNGVLAKEIYMNSLLDS